MELVNKISPNLTIERYRGIQSAQNSNPLYIIRFQKTKSHTSSSGGVYELGYPIILDKELNETSLKFGKWEEVEITGAFFEYNEFIGSGNFFHIADG